MNNLKVYAPKIYEGVIEMNALLDAESVQLSIIQNEISSAKNNQYVSTADESGILLFEQIFNIDADPSIETIEFRRERVINRFSTVESPTAKSLRSQLDLLLGKNSYEIEFVYADYEIQITTHIGVYGKIEELKKTLLIIVPANMLIAIDNVLPVTSTATLYEGSAVINTMHYIIN